MALLHLDKESYIQRHLAVEPYIVKMVSGSLYSWRRALSVELENIIV